MLKFPCGGRVNLGKVRHRITYFVKLYALSAVMLERKLAGHRELHLQPPLYIYNVKWSPFYGQCAEQLKILSNPDGQFIEIQKCFHN